MRNSKHTPGPWKVENHEHQVGPYTSAKFEIWNQNRHIGTIHEHADDVSIDGANAALIAAAPELYEMLDKINAAFYTRTTRKEWLALMEQTKPLLQKARGTK